MSVITENKIDIDFSTGNVEIRFSLEDYELFHDVEEYYDYHEHELGYSPFAFKGGMYKVSPNSKSKIPVCLKHPDAKNYIRVIGDFYKYVLDAVTEKTVLRGWDVKALNIDYGHIKNFKYMIESYDGFCVYPSNTNFKRVINNHYNMYEPIHHIPKEGSFENIQMYFEHIFGDSLEMGFDYFSILWKTPYQKLPIPALVSTENGTGKSTMIDLMKAIWGENAIMIGNSEIASEFNTTYASKLIVGIDEGFIEKKTVLEKIKSIATRQSILLNDKNVKVKEIPCHIHFIICTNNETNFVNMSSEDTRFWVLKINKIQKTVFNLLEKMVAEIPAFINFLENREISIPCEDRFWFAPHRFETEAKKVMVEASLPKNVKILKEFFDEFFEKSKRKTANFTKSDLNLILKQEGGNGTFDHEFLKRYMKYEKSNRAVTLEHDTFIFPYVPTKELGRYYTFYAEDYISQDLFNELFPSDETTQTTQATIAFDEAKTNTPENAQEILSKEMEKSNPFIHPENNFV